MRAVRATQTGDPDVLVLTEIADPVAGPGQVVVDVSVAPVLFVDTQIRRGWGAEFFHVTAPYVPGAGAAGHVAKVGAGVDASWLGRRVVTDVIGGGYADQALAEAASLVPVPDGLDLRDAAALLHDGRTAMRLAELVPLRADDEVLVSPASGALGGLLVQLAHAAGAHVVATARGQAKLDLVREQGADVVVDNSAAGWADQVVKATGGAGPAVVFDGAGGELGRAAFEIAAPGARISAHGAPSGAFTKIDQAAAIRRGLTVTGIADVQLTPAAAVRLTALALAEASAGRIKPVVGQTFRLDQASEAHAAIEARETVGKTLLLT